MDDRNEEYKKEIDDFLRREWLRNQGRNTFFLIGLFIILAIGLLWPAVRPARTFVAYEYGLVQSSASTQTDDSPPSIQLLLKTADNTRIRKATRASDFRVRGDKVCLKKYQANKSEKLSYELINFSKCDNGKTNN
jgi:hypothetical protein